jgi:hypothetical protein
MNYIFINEFKSCLQWIYFHHPVTEYLILYPHGLESCMKFFRNQKEFKSIWSNDEPV